MKLPVNPHDSRARWQRKLRLGTALSRLGIASAFAVCTATASLALAAPGDDTDEAVGDRRPPTEAAASVGSFSPLTQSASVEHQRAMAVGFGGYDSARSHGTFEALTEVRVWGPIAIRGGAVYTTGIEGARALRPTIGARVQVLREQKSGVDAAVGVAYRPEGLTEPEGEIEGTVAVGAHAGRTYLLGNVLYGQDPEGRERDGELRLAALHPLANRFFAGLDARGRYNLGSVGPGQVEEPKYDVLAGPTGLAVLGPVAISLQGGYSRLKLAGNTSNGAFVLTGIGASF